MLGTILSAAAQGAGYLMDYFKSKEQQRQEDAPNVALSMDVLIQLLTTFKEFGDIDLSNIKIVKKQD